MNSLPGGYRSETIAGANYYYHNGHYYQPRDRGYVVVAAPRESRYYSDYGRYQRTNPPSQMLEPEAFNRNEGQYEHGKVITRLPDGYREVNHGGNTYYQTRDRYYRRQGDRYIIVGSPF